MFVAIIDQGYQDAKESLEVHPITGSLVTVKFVNGKVLGSMAAAVALKFQEKEEAAAAPAVTAAAVTEKKKKKQKKTLLMENIQGQIVQVNVDGTYDIAFRQQVNAGVGEQHSLARKWNPDPTKEWDVSSNEDDWIKVVKRGVQQSALVFIPERKSGSILTVLLTQWVNRLFRYGDVAKKTVKEAKEKVRKLSQHDAHKNEQTEQTRLNRDGLVIEDDGSEQKILEDTQIVKVNDTKIVPVQ